MNLENVNSVNDLLTANAQEPQDENSTFQLVLDNLDAVQALELATKVVNQLAIYHQNTRQQLTEDGECERACLWAFDEAQLAQALNCLQSVSRD